MDESGAILNDALRPAMKLRWKLLFALSLILNCIFLIAFGLPILNQQLNPPRPPDRTSAFLKTYTPQPVIEPFMSDVDGFGMGESKGGWSASRGNFNERELQPNFAIERAHEYLLMTAVANDIDTQLARYGAVVLSKKGDLQSGFTFTYKLGTTTGTVDLSPLADSSYITHRNRPLPDGISDVTFTVKIVENPGI